MAVILCEGHSNLREAELSSEIWESHAKRVCEPLNEQPRRWVAGWLSEVIGWGGTKQIAQATGIVPKTIRQGRFDSQGVLVVSRMRD